MSPRCTVLPYVAENTEIVENPEIVEPPLDPRPLGGDDAAVFARLPITPVPAFTRPASLRLVSGGRAPESERSAASARAWSLAVRTGHPSASRLRVAGAGVPRAGEERAERVGEVRTVPASRAKVAARRRPRLTRRGRLVLLLGFVLVLTAAAFLSGRVSSAAATGSSGSVTPASYPTVVVQPGDTLWSIALHAAPRTDPRVTVQRIIDINALHGADVQPGQQLSLPS